MNYLRGAVNAISAPYQYYKDLNPSTLTGAIDVIVIRRPKQQSESNSDPNASGSTDIDTELVCSPFHVRFGKWQVLRPQDKKVNVFVNGNPVPFPMKIGEAGEAFFVFETEEDIPDDLVTSPLLEATRPGESNAQVEQAGRFGTKEGADKVTEVVSSSQEPEFLDLDASLSTEKPAPLGDSGIQSAISRSTSLPSEPSVESADQRENGDALSALSRTAQLGKTMIGAAVETEKTQLDKLKDKTLAEATVETEKDERAFLTDKVTAAKHTAWNSTAETLGFAKGDEALPEVDADKGQPPDVLYTDNVVLDAEGYHSHTRDRSDDTVTSSGTKRSSLSEPTTPDRTPGPSRSPSPSPSTSPEPESGGIPFPSYRATSEPPPDLDSDLTPTTSSHVSSFASTSRTPPTPSIRSSKGKIPALHTENSQEYMWEWGNFPQKTPVRTTFGHGSVAGGSVDHTSGKWKGKGRFIAEEFPDEIGTADGCAAGSEMEEGTVFGTGGRLTADRTDPTRFKVLIEGRMVEFELSLVPNVSGEDFGGEKGAKGSRLGGEDEVEDARRFTEGKVDFIRFMEDDSVVANQNLVLRWAGDMYITPKDGSPLMDALIHWREAAIRRRLSSRFASPTSDDDVSRPKEIDEDVLSSSDERPHTKRASTDIFPPADKNRTTEAEGETGKPSSSPWVRWWGRSRRVEVARPDLRLVNTEPFNVAARDNTKVKNKLLSTPVIPRPSSAASAPPEIAGFQPAPSDVTVPSRKRRRKKYAKTLRLTSDQLSSLNLKPGANSITFSLSTTGVTACSARLFVWDSTDLVVVSDIDGTITKSDALGHVFTMIGRDWTHLGVAKLYTDICRNGYKILYLTSRAIGQADSTRDYLKGIKQNDYQLPEGPVIMSPDRLMASLHREVIMRKPEVFKMACLRDIQKLFGSSSRNPFYAGFGNRITDALSYRSVSIPSSRIFTIDSTGEVKMELLELAGYKSSYIHMTDLVDQMFPPIHRKWAAEYTDFNYWKTPMQDFPLPDLAPPSPALSARSDTSNQSALARLRNFSLVSSRQTTKQFSLPPPATEASEEKRRDGNEMRLHKCLPSND
ncbi:Nuclear elongation and deformation protein 1 [Grifola frondosa]|uniref:phosphatidate phosphatase n=1 Tax=Grifola frondosa TaxID=5627 RepID=A0A1C7LZB4_GRIFR|nr:Nuclear elongation and deformation protein 1 [Grifola frondosa]